MVTFIESFDDFNSIIGSDNYTLIDFTAKWCGPCQRLAPDLEKMAEEYLNVCSFYKVDVDCNEETCCCCEITCMPTLILFKNNEIVTKYEGSDINKIKEMLNNNI